MDIRTFPSTCAMAADGKHNWKSFIDYSKPAVQVLPMVWGQYRKIICTACGKRRESKEENGEFILEE